MEDLMKMVRRFLAQGVRTIDLFPPPSTRKRREIAFEPLFRGHASDAEALASDWRAVGKDLLEAAVRERVRERVGKLGNWDALNDWLMHHDQSRHGARRLTAAERQGNACDIKGAIRQEFKKQGEAAPAWDDLVIFARALSDGATTAPATAPTTCRAGSVKVQKKRA